MNEEDSGLVFESDTADVFGEEEELVLLERMRGREEVEQLPGAFLSGNDEPGSRVVFREEVHVVRLPAEVMKAAERGEVAKQATETTPEQVLERNAGDQCRNEGFPQRVFELKSNKMKQKIKM